MWLLKVTHFKWLFFRKKKFRHVLHSYILVLSSQHWKVCIYSIWKTLHMHYPLSERCIISLKVIPLHTCTCIHVYVYHMYQLCIITHCLHSIHFSLLIKFWSIEHLVLEHSKLIYYVKISVSPMIWKQINRYINLNHSLDFQLKHKISKVRWH